MKQDKRNRRKAAARRAIMAYWAKEYRAAVKRLEWAEAEAAAAPQDAYAEFIEGQSCPNWYGHDTYISRAERWLMEAEAACRNAFTRYMQAGQAGRKAARQEVRA